MKRKLTLLLALLMTAQISACGDAQGSTDDTTTANPDNDVTTPEVTTEAEPLILPEGLNYNNYEFRVFSRIGRYLNEIYVEEATGNLINDKTYERNQTVEELLGIKIVPIYSESSDWENASIAPILAGEDAYDALFTHARSCMSYGAQSGGLNWHEMPNINIEHSYWKQDFIDNMTVNGKLYAMASDISWSNLAATTGMLFSKELFDDYQIAYPYDDVIAGTWTFDKFQTIAKQFSGDLNDDGKLTREDDLFGYLTDEWAGPIEILYSTGGRVISPDEDGLPQLTFYNERTVDAYDSFITMLRQDYAKFGLSGDRYKTFLEGRAAFTDLDLVQLQTGLFPDAEMEFGLVPWPKFDESIDKYYSYVDAGSTLCVIPVTVQDQERTGAVLEAMAYYGHKMIIPAYYDVTLQNRYLRDEMSVQMLDYISEGRTFDLAYFNDSQYGGAFANVGRNLAKDETLNFTSYYEANKSSVETKIEKANQYYLGE